MGKDRWFMAHRLLMVLAVLFSIVAFILAMAEKNLDPLNWDYVQKYNHPALGLATLVLAFIQPIIAFFRPHPGTPRRSIFNWAHWLVGNTAHILAIVTLYMVSKLSPDLTGLDSNVAATDTWNYVLLAYVCFHVLVHISLSVLMAKSETATSPVQDQAMRDLGGSPITMKEQAQLRDAPNSVIRKVLLAVYVVVTLVIVAVLAAGIFQRF